MTQKEILIDWGLDRGNLLTLEDFEPMLTGFVEVEWMEPEDFHVDERIESKIVFVWEANNACPKISKKEEIGSISLSLTYFKTCFGARVVGILHVEPKDEERIHTELFSQYMAPAHTLAMRDTGNDITPSNIFSNRKK